ncbi:MAG: hypothetical protein EBR82_10040 [Caulobacteraceae bacterium]|nr:hypothetical protein [Caulobacteraceae bacterium]
MANFQEVTRLSLPANADLSADQYKFVVVNSSGKVAVNTTSGGRVAGVLDNKPNAADVTAVVTRFGAKALVKAGAAITRGALVMSDNAGLAVTATTGGHIQGQALQAAGASGDIIEISLDYQGTV